MRETNHVSKCHVINPWTREREAKKKKKNEEEDDEDVDETSGCIQSVGAAGETKFFFTVKGKVVIRN